MRHYIIPALVFGFMFMVIAVIYVGHTDMMAIIRTKQSEINYLKNKNQVERDSLESILKLTSDSLDIAFATIRLAKEETQKAKEKSQREIRTLKSILFVQHTDSSRNAELVKLYPTFKP